MLNEGLQDDGMVRHKRAKHRSLREHEYLMVWNTVAAPQRRSRHRDYGGMTLSTGSRRGDGRSAL